MYTKHTYNNVEYTSTQNNIIILKSFICFEMFVVTAPSVLLIYHTHVYLEWRERDRDRDRDRESVSEI